MDLLQVFIDSLTSGRLPVSSHRPVITVLPKKGDLLEIKNWRPVPLLCCDYKLLSKVNKSNTGYISGGASRSDLLCPG